MVETQPHLDVRDIWMPATAARSLVVLLHAYNQEPPRMKPLAYAIQEWHPACDILIPSLPFSIFSFADPAQVAGDIVSKIDELGTGRYEDIMLIGHSIGAILARKIWVISHGITAGDKRNEPRPWASKVGRIVQLAALNRGWALSSALNPWARVSWTIGKMWGNVCRHGFAKEPLIFGFQRGAPFLTSIRLQCLALQQILGQSAPLVVQLIGSIDDMVAPTDNVDLATGSLFSYIEVDGVKHEGIVDVTPASRDALRIAIVGTSDEIGKVRLDPGDVYDLHIEENDDYDLFPPPRPNADVHDVVFVVHGIRDRGFWTRRIARRMRTKARERAPGTQGCKTVTSTYGFFAMGPFLIPWVRRDKVHWLLDQYVTAKSLYPIAEISYVGHSNGTYLLAKAMTLCPDIKIKRAIFAGSVVRSDFEWRQFLDSGRLGALINYVATKDWIVALFPNGLQGMGQDLGGAGHYGFHDEGPVNLRFITGSHGAALSADHWSEMCDFILDGTVPPKEDFMGTQSCFMKVLGATSPLICAALLVFILGILLAILLQFSVADLGWLALFLGLLFAIKTVVTEL